MPYCFIGSNAKRQNNVGSMNGLVKISNQKIAKINVTFQLRNDEGIVRITEFKTYESRAMNSTMCKHGENKLLFCSGISPCWYCY